MKWFEKIENKKDAKFIQFDIESYYPSISRSLLLKAFNYAREFTYISDKSIDIVFHCRKGILWHNGTPWVKKDSPDFDITMGSFDGGQCSDLVGLYILHILVDVHKLFKRSECGLYKDDGLGITRGGGPRAERIKKDLVVALKEEGLGITVDCNISEVNFLDTTLDLKKGEYKPYLKTNAELQYLNTESNHPRCVVKSIPKGVEQRLNQISSNEHCFEVEKDQYEQALSKAGHNVNLEFRKEVQTHENLSLEGPKSKRKNRKRKCIWFNPPHSDTIATNVGKLFLKAVDKHFGSDKELKKLFNRNNIKVSYSCGKNIKQEIKCNNQKVLLKQRGGRNDKDQEERICSCPRNKECPLNGECLTKNLIYRATVSCQGQKDMIYTGQSIRTFKERLANHSTSFKKAYKRTFCSLATYIWDLKLQNKQYTINWKKIKACRTYSRETKRCDLCDSEKNEILSSMIKDPTAVINSRTELMRSCTHRYKELLSDISTEYANTIHLEQNLEPLDIVDAPVSLPHQNLDPLIHSEATDDPLGQNLDPGHSVGATIDNMQQHLDPLDDTGGEVGRSGIQSGLVQQVEQEIEVQHLQNLGSQMMTRGQKASLLRSKLVERGDLDPG